MLTEFELQTKLWEDTVKEFEPDRADVKFSQATSLLTMFMHSIGEIWPEDGYRWQVVEEYNDMAQRGKCKIVRAQSGEHRALGKNWAVISALQAEGRLILLVASEIEHDTNNTNNLNKVENYLAWYTLCRHVESSRQQRLDMTTLYVCGTTCRIGHLVFPGSGKETLNLNLSPPVKVTEASYKKDIPEILSSLADISLKSSGLKNIVRRSYWAPSSASLTA
ncbi:hypothetical protein F5Y09DRAFT_306883 [Xylaria sp. FL1042]|nr:hypothetical protein F5Y09DRAFT_306883 [Xylaria sp. FL1042]